MVLIDDPNRTVIEPLFNENLETIYDFELLENGGHLIIMTFAINGPIKCSGLDIVQYDAKKLMAELGPGFELIESGHETHITPAGKQQKFAYVRLLFTPESF